ncbi:MULTISPECIES: hypothetical protein [Eggerthellaceae]|uniref:DUF2721 domain-containing protein n=1 Tax=Gordonibacter faecis TaxID=3047475 RepID=A0ABT7DT63_9ACTN|nr:MULTISPECIES: hypothetical protein [Eggerthellaceae]MCB7038994.1 hypothetical protein [Eggerthella sinensis]MDJ1651798.1 hypothetical protein [Gordonibacter sp. KGMB12511]HIW75668.1 hypothetical protein [Candidatus Gordonibacter avicola]
MGDIELSALDPISFCAFIVLTIVANAASGTLAQFGWRNAAKKDIELYKGLVSISEEGDMDDLACKMKESIRKKLCAALSRQSSTSSYLSAFKSRIPELVSSTIVCWAVAVFVFLVSPELLPLDFLQLYLLASLLAGIAIQGLSAAAIVSKKRSR